MRIKRFQAQGMTEALRAVKQEFGPDAVILSARSLKREGGIFGALRKPGVEVTAATDTFHAGTIRSPSLKTKDHGTSSGPVPLEKSIGGKSLIRSLGKEIGGLGTRINPFARRNAVQRNNQRETSLLFHRMVEQEVAEDIVSRLSKEAEGFKASEGPLKNKEIELFMTRVLKKMGLSTGPINMANGKRRIISFIGPSGAGKTTTIAKLAAIHALDMGLGVGLITLDNCRIGAIEQLKAYARILGITMKVASNRKELRAALKKLKGKDLILIDTPGTGMRDTKQIAELRTILDRTASSEIHLVLSAASKEKDLMETIDGFGAIPIHRLIFTRLDETGTYGAILNLTLRTKIPLSYFTTGQQVPEGIEIASSERLMNYLVSRGQETATRSLPEGTSRVEQKERDVSNPPEKGFYVANRNSVVFHHPACKWAKRIKRDNMITFESVTEAIDGDFNPCRLCHPDSVQEYLPAFGDTEGPKSAVMPSLFKRAV